MIRFFKLFIFFLLIFNINNKAEAITGIGPIKFDSGTMDHFFAYLRGDGQPKGEVGKKKGTPLAFAVNPEGTWSQYYYCPIMALNIYILTLNMLSVNILELLMRQKI